MFGSEVREAEEALAQVAAGWDRLASLDLSGIGADDAARLIALLERQVRRGRAAPVDLLREIDRGGAHLADGHASAKVMVRHHGRLSNPEAAARERTMRMLRDLPAMAAAHAAGSVGTDHVRRLALVWANPRVRHHLPVCEREFLDAARTLEYPDFDSLCKEWEATVDQDGPTPSARRWRRREVKLVQDHNGFWDLRARLGSGVGAELHTILSRLTDAERLADVEATKASHGDEWRVAMDRTEGQRRHDAFVDLMRRGAAAGPDDGGDLDTTVNYVIDQQSFDDGVRRLLGAEADPDPLAAFDPDRFSRTADGIWVRPEEIVARALTGHVRRVVLDTAGVVVEMGRRRRLFTGAARDAALLQATACYWPGCWVPASACQIDHLTPSREGGGTDPANGLPACGGHNRIKERGFHAWRDPAGTWHLTRPDGTPVPDHLAHWPDPPGDPPDEPGLAA